MIRACAKCRKVLGVKCPECGTEAEFSKVEADYRVIMRCPSQVCCIREFPIGESGVSHGMCDPCGDAMYGFRPKRA
jgi:hypothetical protein